MYLWAVNDDRSEGDRTVVIQHSVISADKIFDGAAVRQVNVRVYDDDTPGVYAVHVEPSPPTCTSATPSLCQLDDRGVVIEGGTPPPRD